MTHIFFFIVFTFLPILLAMGQTDTTSLDSIQSRKGLTETRLQKILEESLNQLDDQPKHLDDLEISELIVNAVISKPGNDFFDFFTSDFIWPETEGDFIILISEKPARNNSTQIFVTVNDLEVFENIIQPRASYLEELAEYAQRITKQYILNYQQIIKDLDGDDRSGSGIY
jgi:curli production assembly/transport component CsgE